jgi:uncharacterized protein (TIGR00369 family)
MSMSGIDYVRALAAGRVAPPPVAALLGISLLDVQRGRVAFEMEVGEHLFNPIGCVHGGMLSTLLDSAMGCAVHTTLPAGIGYTTLDLKVTFVHQVTSPSGVVRCDASVLHSGRTVAVAEGRITNETGRLIAHATTTCLVMAPRGGDAVMSESPTSTAKR